MIRLLIQADLGTASTVARHLGVSTPTTADLMRAMAEVLLTQASLRADASEVLADVCSYDVEIKVVL